MISDVIIENEIYLLQEYFCQTGQNTKVFCHPERSRKSDATADDADLGLAKTNLLARRRRASNMPGSTLAKRSLSTAFDYLCGVATT